MLNCGTIRVLPLHIAIFAMNSPYHDQLKARRRLLQNPYAHIEQLEELRVARLHENPYLFVDRQSVDSQAQACPSTAHRVSTIEQLATNLQREIWGRRAELGALTDAHPVDVLEAKYAAQVLGYGYSMRSSLGWITRGKDPIVAAGLIDNSKRIIQVATDVDPRVARFTSAHEIGHAVLHPQLTGLHRDRPLAGPVEHRNRVEYEADKFAAFFLMPCKLVTEHFLLRFIAAFNLDEQTSFALLGKPPSSARRLLPTRRHTSRALAGATQFNGRNFVSLAEYFGVSVETMAIRLEELGLAGG